MRGDGVDEDLHEPAAAQGENVTEAGTVVADRHRADRPAARRPDGAAAHAAAAGVQLMGKR